MSIQNFGKLREREVGAALHGGGGQAPLLALVFCMILDQSLSTPWASDPSATMGTVIPFLPEWLIFLEICFSCMALPLG